MYLKLRAKRVEKGLTQRDLAKLLNLAPCNYNKKEKGKVDFKLEEVKEILKILDSNFDDIFLN